MDIRNSILKLVSYFTPKPVYKGMGLTVDPVKVDQDPTIAQLDRVVSYRINPDMGPFEIRQIIHERANKVKYVIYHVSSDREFKMSKEWFEFFFEEIEPPQSQDTVAGTPQA